MSGVAPDMRAQRTRPKPLRLGPLATLARLAADAPPVRRPGTAGSLPGRFLVSFEWKTALPIESPQRESSACPCCS